MLDRVATCSRRCCGRRRRTSRGGGARATRRDARAWKRRARLSLAVAGGAPRLLDLFTKSAGDVLDRWFESTPIKAAFGFDAVVGNFASPYAPGSAYVLLHHVFGEVNGKRGSGATRSAAWARSRRRWHRSARARRRVRPAPRGARDRRAGARTGVALRTARRAGRRVVANVNPRLLFERLVRPSTSTPISARASAATMRLGHVPDERRASRAARFRALPGRNAQPHHASGIIVAPSLRYMERAYFDARTDGWSKAPIVEVLIPSTVDDRSRRQAARREPLLPARESGHRGVQPVRRGTIIASASPT
jgi:phytoene dehydrogenase-like protein